MPTNHLRLGMCCEDNSHHPRLAACLCLPGQHICMPCPHLPFKALPGSPGGRDAVLKGAPRGQVSMWTVIWTLLSLFHTLKSKVCQENHSRSRQLGEGLGFVSVRG